MTPPTRSSTTCTWLSSWFGTVPTLDVGDETSHELMALSALLLADSRSAWPWVAAERLGEPSELPLYLNGLLDNSRDLDLTRLRDRVDQLRQVSRNAVIQPGPARGRNHPDAALLARSQRALAWWAEQTPPTPTSSITGGGAIAAVEDAVSRLTMN